MPARSKQSPDTQKTALKVIADTKALLKPGIELKFSDVSAKSYKLIHTRLYDLSRAGKFDVRFSRLEFGPQYNVNLHYDESAKLLRVSLREHMPGDDDE